MKNEKRRKSSLFGFIEWLPADLLVILVFLLLFCIVINHTSAAWPCCVALIFYRCSRKPNQILVYPPLVRECLLNNMVGVSKLKTDPEAESICFWTFASSLNHLQTLWEAGSRETVKDKGRRSWRVQVLLQATEKTVWETLGGNAHCCSLGAFCSSVNRRN